MRLTIVAAVAASAASAEGSEDHALVVSAPLPSQAPAAAGQQLLAGRPGWSEDDVAFCWWAVFLGGQSVAQQQPTD